MIKASQPIRAWLFSEQPSPASKSREDWTGPTGLGEGGGSYLQDLPSDVLLTALTLDPKHGVVVRLAVRNPVSARTECSADTDTGAPGASQGAEPGVRTYLLMYSALSTLLHTRHLKQPRCQCLSRATRDCSVLNSLPQPQQSGDTASTHTAQGTGHEGTGHEGTGSTDCAPPGWAPGCWPGPAGCTSGTRTPSR